MGTIHKFTRPPKNENQFKGFRPLGPAAPKQGQGRWKKLRAAQPSLLVWALLIAVAAGLVAVRMLFKAMGW